MNTKKIVILLVIFIFILIGLGSIFSKLFESQGEKNPVQIQQNGYVDEKIDKTQAYDPKYQTNVSAMDYAVLNKNQKKGLDDLITYLLEKINQKDADALYAILDEDYKTIKYPTVESLKSYLNNNFTGTYTCGSYEVNSTNCYIRIHEVIKNGSNEETMRTKPMAEIMVRDYRDVGLLNASGEKATNDAMPVEEYLDQITLYMERVDAIVPSLTYFMTKEIRGNVQYLANYGNGKNSIYVELLNLTDRTQRISLNGTKIVYSIAGEDEEVSLNDSPEIKISDRGKTTVELYYEGKMKFEPSLITFELNINGNKYTKTVGIIEQEYDDE